MIFLRLIVALILVQIATFGAGTDAPVPASVEAYREELKDPDRLAEEMIRARREKERTNSSTLSDIAFSAMRSEKELDDALADGIQTLDAKAKAAFEKRKAVEQPPDVHRAEAKLWERLAKLHNAADAPKAALDATLRRLDAMVQVATPEEWLNGALDAVAAYQRGGKEDKATEWFEKCKQLVGEEATLRTSAAAKARIQLMGLRMTARPVNELSDAAPEIEKALGPKHPEVIACVEDIFAGVRQSSYDITRPGERLIAAREAIYGPKHPATLRTVALVGTALNSKGKRAEGCALLRRAMDGWIEGAGIGSEERMLLVRRVSNFERENGEYEAAEKSCRALIAASVKARGDDARETLWVRNDLAIIMGGMGDYAGAEKLNRELWEIRKRVFGAEEPDTLTSMNNTAVQVSSQGRYREAEKIYRESLELRQKVSGPTHAETLRTKSNIGSVLCTLGEFEEAGKILKETYDARLERLGEDNIDTLSGAYELARIAFARGDIAQAETLAEELVGRRERVSGKSHAHTLGVIELYGEILTEKGDTAKAVEVLVRVNEGIAKGRKKDHPSVISAKLSLGEARLAAADLPTAEPLLREALESYTKLLGAGHPHSLQATASIGELLVKKKDLAGAEPLLRAALKGAETAFDAQHPFVAKCALLLAEALAAAGKQEEARTLAATAAAIAEKKLVAGAPFRERCRKLIEKLGQAPR